MASLYDPGRAFSAVDWKVSTTIVASYWLWSRSIYSGLNRFYLISKSPIVTTITTIDVIITITIFIIIVIITTIVTTQAQSSSAEFTTIVNDINTLKAFYFYFYFSNLIRIQGSLNAELEDFIGGTLMPGA